MQLRVLTVTMRLSLLLDQRLAYASGRNLKRQGREPPVLLLEKQPVSHKGPYGVHVICVYTHKRRKAPPPEWSALELEQGQPQGAVRRSPAGWLRRPAQGEPQRPVRHGSRLAQVVIALYILHGSGSSSESKSRQVIGPRSR